MTFDQEMERFWRAFTKTERRRVESDCRYQAATAESNPAKAQEVAFAHLCGGDGAKRRLIADALQEVNSLCPD